MAGEAPSSQRREYLLAPTRLELGGVTPQQPGGKLDRRAELVRGIHLADRLTHQRVVQPFVPELAPNQHPASPLPEALADQCLGVGPVVDVAERLGPAAGLIGGPGAVPGAPELGLEAAAGLGCGVEDPHGFFEGRRGVLGAYDRGLRL